MTPRANIRPALLPTGLLKHNLHCTGGAGSGKTHLIGVALARQLLVARNASLTWLDLKSDLAARAALKEEADRCGLPFAEFSIDPRLASNLWNPLIDPAFTALSDIEKSDLLIEACGISQGVDSKNGDYFPNMARWLARGLFSYFGDRIDSAYTMRSILSRRTVRRTLGLTKKDFDNASSFTASMDVMASSPQMNATHSMRSIHDSFLRFAISIDEILTRPTVCYFHLPASLSPTLSKLVSRLLVLMLFNRAGMLGKRNNHLHVFVDEFTETLHSMWGTPLRQARSREMSFALFHQQIADLDKCGLLDTVLGNTAVRIACAARDSIGREFWENIGGDRTYSLKATTRSTGSSPTGPTESESVQDRQTEGQRFTADVLNSINADSRRVLVDAAPCEGFWQFKRPVVVELMPPGTKLEFEALDRTPWPKADGLSTIRGEDLRHLFPTIRPEQDPRDDDPDEPDEPEPPEPTPPAKAGQRRRPRKPIDPDETARAEAMAEYLKKLKREQGE